MKSQKNKDTESNPGGKDKSESSQNQGEAPRTPATQGNEETGGESETKGNEQSKVQVPPERDPRHPDKTNRETDTDRTNPAERDPAN